MKLNEKIEYIQIGFQKCGTTFLEKRFYDIHPEIEIHQLQRFNHLDQFLKKELILKDSADFEVKDVVERFNEIADKYFKTNKKLGFLYESFTFTYQKRFDRKVVLNQIKKVFPNAKIIFFIRNQYDWIQSHYSQYIQSGGLLSLYDFVENILHNPYLDYSYLYWDNTIEALLEIFGEDNVKVYTYEEFKDSPQHICNNIAEFMKVSEIQVDTSYVNKSFSKEALQLKRFLNHIIKHQYGISSYNYSNIGLFDSKLSSFQKFIYKLRYSLWKPLTLKACMIIDKFFKFKSKVILSEKHIKNIENMYSKHNKKLEKILDKNLKNYGYLR